MPGLKNYIIGYRSPIFD